MTSIRVPLFVPDLGEMEVAAVTEVIRSGWISMGPQTEAFERAFAERLGVAHAVALNSCTAALHVANHLFGIGPGDTVVVPSLTFAATANAVAFTGATPVFADIVSEDDWTMDPDSVAAAISPNSRAVVCMHYGGFPCDMTRLAKVCGAAGLPLVEDACHGLGGRIDSRAMGTIGAVGCFSFYSNKVITTAEGGMLTTDNPKLAARARRLRSHGMTATAIDRMRGAAGYDISEVGWNYRLDDIRAAIGLVQLRRLDDALRRRRDLVDRYYANLAAIPKIRVPSFGGRGDPAHYILPVAVTGVDRDAVRARLAERGVQTSIHYPPAHRFSQYSAAAPELPVTEWVAAHAITLPLYPSMTDAHVDLVCSELDAAIARR
jgi:dTDP-4-amino-4,6-dideoxygalactose transaminase